MTEESVLRVDARFLFCPEPIRLLHQHMRSLVPLGVIELQATDPTTEADVRQFCHFLGHELIEATQQDQVWLFKIRKKQSAD
jgi:tRNA 2-thiouridine synthesizing protein A